MAASLPGSDLQLRSDDDEDESEYEPAVADAGSAAPFLRTSSDDPGTAVTADDTDLTAEGRLDDGPEGTPPDAFSEEDDEDALVGLGPARSAQDTSSSDSMTEIHYPLPVLRSQAISARALTLMDSLYETRVPTREELAAWGAEGIRKLALMLPGYRQAFAAEDLAVLDEPAKVVDQISLYLAHCADTLCQTLTADEQTKVEMILNRHGAESKYVSSRYKKPKKRHARDGDARDKTKMIFERIYPKSTEKPPLLEEFKTDDPSDDADRATDASWMIPETLGDARTLGVYAAGAAFDESARDASSVPRRLAPRRPKVFGLPSKYCTTDDQKDPGPRENEYLPWLSSYRSHAERSDDRKPLRAANSPADRASSVPGRPPPAACSMPDTRSSVDLAAYRPSDDVEIRKTAFKTDNVPKKKV